MRPLSGRRLAVAVLATGGIVVARLLLVDAVVVSSESMRPTFCAGDWLLLLRAGSGSRADRGDLVVFDSPVDGAASLKRVVAVGGQQVEIRDAVLHVDGSRMPEPYVDVRTVDGTFYGPVVVPDGRVFVMGDDREHSIDSRSYGAVSRNRIEGRVLSRVWSSCD